MSDTAFTEIAAGLTFPEGPVAMPDGSVVVVEMLGERVTRVHPDGTTDLVCEVKGGPNGLAVGPDGALYLCNNGGCFTPAEVGALLVPGPFDLERYTGGLIQRIDHDGAVHNLYTNCAGRPLRAPNDLVMDGHGGFYFTDYGIHDVGARTADLSALYYARCDGSDIHEVAYPVQSPNGIGLSPDGNDAVLRRDVHRSRVPPANRRAGRTRTAAIEVRPVGVAVRPARDAVARLARGRRRRLGGASGRWSAAASRRSRPTAPTSISSRRTTR